MNIVLRKIKSRIAIVICITMMLEIPAMPVDASVIGEAIESTGSISSNAEFDAENEEGVSDNEETSLDDENSISDNEVIASENEVVSENTISDNVASDSLVSDNGLTSTQKRFYELLKGEYDSTRETINIPQDELEKRDAITGKPRPDGIDAYGERVRSYSSTSFAATSLAKSQVYSNAMLENQRTDEAYLEFYTMPIYEEGSEENELIAVTAQMILESYISQKKLEKTPDDLTDFEKMEAAHDWICGHIYYCNYRINFSQYQDADVVLKSATLDPDYQTEGHEPRMLAVCEGYSNVMEAIMREYGIPCINVSGVGGSCTDEEFYATVTDHAWNHVYLKDENGANGRWYFVDNTWDSGNYTESSTTTLKYKEGITIDTYYKLESYPEDHLLVEANWYSGTPKAFEPEVNADGVCRIPDGIKYLECSAFDGVQGVKSVDVPDSVIVMESSCLQLSDLEAVDLSKNLAVFETFSIQSDQLKSITMSGQKECNGSYFSVIDNTVYGGEGVKEALVLSVGPDNSSEFRIADTTKYIVYGSIQGPRITYLVIPDSVVSMESRAIKTPNLQRLDVGSNLTKVYSPTAEGAAWSLKDPNTWAANSQRIQEINVSESNTKYSSVNGIVYNKDRTKLYYIPKYYQEELVMLEETVTDTISGACENENVIVGMPDGITDSILSQYNNKFGGICANSGSTLEQYASRKNIPYYEMPYIKAENTSYYYMIGDTAKVIKVPTAGCQLYYRWIKSDTQSIGDGHVLSGENDLNYAPSTTEGGTYYLWMQASLREDFSTDVVTSGMYSIHVTDSAKTYLENYHFSMKEDQIKGEESIEQYISNVLSSVKTEDERVLEFEKVSYTPLVSATTDSYESMQGTDGSYCFKVNICSNGEVIDTTEELYVKTIPEKIYLEINSFCYSKYYVELGKPITLAGLSFTCSFSDGTSKNITAKQAEEYGIVPYVLMNGTYLSGDAIEQAQESFFNQKRYFGYLSPKGYVYKSAYTILKLEPERAFKNITVSVGEEFSTTFEFPGTIGSIWELSGSLPKGLSLGKNGTKTGLVLSGTPKGGAGGRYYYAGYTTVSVSGSNISMGFSIELDCINPVYTIDYILNGSVNNITNPTQYTYETGAISLKNPIMENSELNDYIFEGWYTDAEFSPDKRINSISKTSKQNYTLYAKWRPPYCITYHLFDGTVSGNMPEYVGKSSGIISLETPVRKDCKFLGWYQNYNESTKVYSGGPITSFDCQTITKDMNFYAKWGKKCNITYVLDGGTNVSSNFLYFYEGDDKLVLGTPTKENARFVGWYRTYNSTLKEYSDPVTTLDFTKESADITLYAKWQNKHSISYHMDGGTNNAGNPSEFYVGDSAFTLLTPTLEDVAREGYVFIGWYTNQAYTNRITVLDFTQEEDIVLYAKWAPPHSITWELNGGTCSSNMPTYYYAASEALTVPIPTKEECKFGGWYRTYNATTEVYSDPVTVLEFSEENEDITLYAKWLIKHTIHYGFMEEFKNADDNPETFYVGDPAFTLLPPTVKGSFENRYVFGGWYADAKFTTPITVLTFDKEADIYIYAERLEFATIAWELNGGTYSETRPEFYTKKTPTLTLGTPVKAGHRFAGWYRSYNQETDVYSDPVTTIDFTKETTAVTLYAKWQSRHEITYHLDGGDNAEGNPSEFYVGDNHFTLLPPTLNDLSRAGYVFGGWYTDATFTNEISVLDFSKAEDIVLYAKWVENSVTINEVPYAWTTQDCIYINWNNGSTKNKTIVMNLPEKSTYQLSRTSCLRDMKSGTLKILGKGTASITVKREGVADKTITISVIECMPRFDTNALKLNKLNSQPMNYTVYSPYHTNISAQGDVFYQKADENSLVMVGLTHQDSLENGTNGIYQYKILADGTAKNGTYTVYMKCILEGGSLQMPQSTVFLPLRVTVTGKLPRVTSKIAKINAFYTDERSTGTVTFSYGENVTVTNISLVPATGRNMPTQDVLDQWYTFSKNGETWALSLKEGVVTEATTLAMIPKKARFCIETEEYGTIYTANLTIPVSLSAPKVIASKSSFALTQYMGAHLSDSFLVSEKIGKQVTPVNLTAAYVTNVSKNTETPTVIYDGAKVTFSIVDASLFAKTKKVKVYVKDENWVKAVAVPIFIQTTQAKPTGKLSKSTLNLNLSYTSITDSATLTFNQTPGAILQMPETLLPSGKNIGSKAPVITISQNADKTYTICAAKSDTTATGTYQYKLIPKAKKDSELISLKTISFKVKVTKNKKPADVSLSLQKGSKIEVTDLETYRYQWKPKLLNVKGTITDVSFGTENPNFVVRANKSSNEPDAVVESFDIYLKHAVATGKYKLPLQFQVRQIDGVYTSVMKNVTVTVAEQSAKVNFSKSSEILHLSVDNQEKRITLTPVSNPKAALSMLTVEKKTLASGIGVICNDQEKYVAFHVTNPSTLTANKTYKIKMKYQFAGGSKVYTKTISIKVKE